MQVILADIYGFCFGVRRAVEMAEQATKSSTDQEAIKSVDTLGPLIHNNPEVTRLANQGIRSVDQIDQIESERVIVRTHGAPPTTFAQLRARNLEIIDATCPFVTKSQHIAARFSQAGYDIVIVGDPNHAEIKGVAGYCTGRFFVIRTIDELDSLPADLRPGLIAQTTTDEAKFLHIVEVMTERYKDMRVYNTVCSATHERQQAARKLAEQVEALFVVGGRQSSNSIKLAEISRASCNKVFLIETADEIDETELNGIERVGVTAGASTPDWLIDAVIARLAAINPDNDRSLPLSA